MSEALLRSGRKVVLVALLLGLFACSGPSMKVHIVFGGGVMIENESSETFTIERLVANNSPENGSCNNYDRKTLAPGESHVVVFLLCGSVNNVEVRTDRGTSSFVVQ